MGDTYREIYALHTNEDSSIAMRAPGFPQASFAVETLVDELAYKIKMDPVEFRKKNLRDEVYHRQLERGAKEIGWSREIRSRRQCWSIETRDGLRCRHVGRRRQQPVQS
jgi:CO/xanthine dehydrogenase Mo-binding subunit